MTPTEKLLIELPPDKVAELARMNQVMAEYQPAMPPAPELAAAQALEDELSALANEQIVAFAAELVVRGERPWFEVWYPRSTEATFDAVEVAPDGTITTLPPYSELGS